MKINAILNQEITTDVATRLAAVATTVKPVYSAVTDDQGDIGALVALERHLEEGMKGDFAVHDLKTYADGSFYLSLGYHSEMSDNIEAIDVFTDLDEEDGEWSLTVAVECSTTRGALRERVRPILDTFGIHPSELIVIEVETEAGSRFGDYRGTAMPWYMTKGEFAFALACGKISTLTALEQVGYASELIKEAVDTELENQFDSRNYPRWVIEFRSSLESEAASDSTAAAQCRRLVEAWDKFAQATKDLIYGVKEEFQKS